MALPSNYRTPPVPPALFGRRPSVSTMSTGHHHKSKETCNPFMQGQPGHPAFAAARFARLAESSDSSNKPLKAPKAPLVPYMRYSKKMWDHVKAANPRIKSIPDIGKMIGKMWQDLSDDERREYEMEYELEKAAYQEALHNYHNSTAYQEWLKKEEMRKLQLAQEAEEKKSITSRIGVVQNDDDEDNIFSLKHLASARYSRNHLLMAEIFSDTIIPDMRQVVFGKKLNNLRSQRDNLETTMSTRQADLKKSEENHEKIRSKILADRKRWDTTWADVCSKKPKLTDELFEQLTNRARQELREKMRQQQQQQQQQQQPQQQQQSQSGSGSDGANSESGGSSNSGANKKDTEDDAETGEVVSTASVEPTRVEVVKVDSSDAGDCVTTAGVTTTTSIAIAGESSKKTSLELVTTTSLSSQPNASQLECLDASKAPSSGANTNTATIITTMATVVPTTLTDVTTGANADSQSGTFQDSVPSSSLASDEASVNRLPEQGEEEGFEDAEDDDDDDDDDVDEIMESEEIEGDLASSASSLPVSVDQKQQQTASSIEEPPKQESNSMDVDGS